MNLRFLIFWCSLKNPTFSVGSSQKNDMEGGLPKRGASAVYKFKGEGLGKKERVVFLMHTMYYFVLFFKTFSLFVIPSSANNFVNIYMKKYSNDILPIKFVT